MKENETPAFGEMSNDELADLVRETPTFKAAVACRQFAKEFESIREDNPELFEQMVDKTHQRQNTNVTKETTTMEIIDEFVDVVSWYANLADQPEKGTNEAVNDVINNG